MGKFLHRICISFFLTLYLFSFSLKSNAQRIGLSTNLIGWTVLSPNIGGEITINHRSTFALDLSFSPWKISEQLSLRHVFVLPEYKYWFHQPMFGHYISLNGLYASYDMYLNHKSYNGNITGLGFGYGYSFILGKRFNLVPSIGIGAGLNLKRGQNIQESWVPLITKVGISLQYLLY